MKKYLKVKNFTLVTRCLRDVGLREIGSGEVGLCEVGLCKVGLRLNPHIAQCLVQKNRFVNFLIRITVCHNLLL